ncbi:MAG TPA: DUF4846 domain-containing protein [Pseudomonadota bacterium]|nr:DUF4846 domain-containing protein [Pseudomonadota bacterium]
MRWVGSVLPLWYLLLPASAVAQAHVTPPPYLFMSPADAARAESLEHRLPPPAEASRVTVPPRSFAAWLRQLPLLPADSPVLLFDGRKKARQDVHAAVVALDVPPRDLQQCADAVMRLQAEYLLSLGKPELIAFHPDPGKPRALTYHGASRADFNRYLIRVFAEAGSASLQAELPLATSPVMPGDVLIQGGHPGHAVLVLDVAERAAQPGQPARRYLLLGQSYMPAQQFHVVRNLGEPALSPWFEEAALDRPAGLATPEWLPFFRRQVRRFPAPPPSR